MKTRLLVTLALLLAFLLPLDAASVWVKVSDRVLKSLGRVEITLMQEDSPVALQGECTSFSINERKHYYLTAAHCFGNTLLVNKQPATVIFRDEVKDVMVLQVPSLKLKALRPALGVQTGEDVGAYGYAYGWEFSFLKTGVVASPPVVQLQMFGLRPITLFSFPFIGGMSGGPVVNSDGLVVSVIQQSNRDGLASLGIALPSLIEAVGEFWDGATPSQAAPSEDLVGRGKASPTQTLECAPEAVNELGRCQF